ncbi:heme-binding protein [Pseudomonas sp. IB20]|uniref:heme acquisition protein HasA n=1 Tax=Pseudomonas TaxID=286 RepID=UPI000BA02FAA|nr:MULTISPECIES: heme acquisition protein HasA [unclassified Pseudomonas]MCV2227081.1 heme acquisition protein HasA [Pseudomonas sp. AU10]OZO03216.1 heme-binding protein [Pseudomonas sp. IB20]
MTISVNYDSAAGSTSLADYLGVWSLGFNTAGHGTGNTGGFNTGAREMNGEQYATHGANGSEYAYIAESDATNGLHYVYDRTLPAGDNMNHYLWGQLDNVQLGEGLTGGAGSEFNLSDYKVSFNGLDLESLVGAGRVGNEVQSVIYGLMQGNTTALESVLNNLLDDFGLSTASTFDQLAAAGLGHATPSADVALVGVQDVAQDWAFAA